MSPSASMAESNKKIIPKNRKTIPYLSIEKKGNQNKRKGYENEKNIELIG